MKLVISVNIYNALGGLVQTKMPAQAAYKVVKNLKIFEPEFKFYEDKRKELISTYFIDGVVDPKRQVELDKAYNELLNVEVTLEPIKIKISELSELELTPTQLLELDMVIEE